MNQRIQVNKGALQIPRQTSGKFTIPPCYLLSPSPSVVFPNKAMHPSAVEQGGVTTFGPQHQTRGAEDGCAVADTAAGLNPKSGELVATWTVTSLT